MAKRDKTLFQMSANLFTLTVRNQPNIFGGSWDGGTYSMEKACPVCGTGAIRLDPLKYPVPRCPVPQAKLPNKVFLTLTFELIVPESVAEQVRLMCPECIRPLIDSKTNNKLPYAQILEQATLPPFNKQNSKGFQKSKHRLEISCSHCHRDGFFNIANVPLQLEYDSISAEFFSKDILATWECFGKSRLGDAGEKALYALPFFVLSERIAAIFRPLSGIELEPVRTMSQL